MNDEECCSKIIDRLVKEVYFGRDYEFTGLNVKQIEQLRADYARLRSKKLAPPMAINDTIRKDLLTIWDNETHRLHFLAFQGIKELKKFKQACKKQLKSEGFEIAKGRPR